MIEGIFITIGIILVIGSRFLYGMFDITLGGDSANSFTGCSAIITDILGTVLILFSALNYSGIYKLFG